MMNLNKQLDLPNNCLAGYYGSITSKDFTQVNLRVILSVS